MAKHFRNSLQLLLLIGGCCVACSAQRLANQSCESVRAILDDASAITINTTRAVLEATFEVGSLSFRNAATYISKKCRYVAVDVEFEVDASSPGPPAPTDKVKKISRPYLAYPAMD